MTGTIGHGMDKVDSLGGSSFEKLAFYCVLHCAKENPFKMDPSVICNMKEILWKLAF